MENSPTSDSQWTSCVRGCSHEKTCTSARFITGWLFCFISHLHYDWVISYLVTCRYSSCWWSTRKIQNRKHYACPTHSSLPADQFHTETCGRFAFTRYRCEILYWSEILAPTRVNSRRGDSCQHDILWWYHVNKCRPMRGNWSQLAPVRKSPRCYVKTH